MTSLAVELRLKIIRKRHTNALVVAAALVGILLSFWLYDYSGIAIPYYISGVITILVLLIGIVFDDAIRAIGNVACPRCNAIVEAGRLPGHPMPKACPSCGLLVSDTPP